MASSVALTIERANSTSDRAGLGSSFGSQRSYGTVKESSSQPLTASGRLLCGHIEHVVHAEDTLPGLALKYEVSVSRPRLCESCITIECIVYMYIPAYHSAVELLGRGVL